MTNQRTFERVPRVMRCADQRRGVVFFHSSDNHYGNPREVMLNLASRDSRFKRERFYGVADRQQSGAFPLFLPKVHVISKDRIPPAACDVEDQDAVKVVGTDYLFVDPCDGRNFFMTWIRFCSNKCAYVFWEWPNQVDPVPGHGVLGEWALPSGDSKLMDGRKGPAQSSLGWGLLQYKQEIARIEKWPDYRPDAKPEDIRAWSQYQPGSKVKPRVRYLDARFGNANSLLEDGVRTLFEEFDDIGLTFAETGSGRRNEIEEGKLVYVSDVEAAQARVHQAVISDILSACESIAPRLEGLSVRAMAAKLKEAMTDALRHIATKEQGANDEL